jgi:tetratricopeptide (TPR) repeat protein
LEAALERFEYANGLMRDLPAPLWCIADVYEKMDRWDEAASFHRRAVAVDPDDRQAKRLYRRFRRRRRDREAGR